MIGVSNVTIKNDIDESVKNLTPTGVLKNSNQFKSTRKRRKVRSDSLQLSLFEDAELLVAFREAITEKPGKRAKDNSDNVTNKTERGNTKAYTLTRLAKDATHESLINLFDLDTASN